MIDTHCHILPGLDDGAKHIEESVAMAKEAINQGIHTIVATPHHKNGRYDNPKEKVLSAVENLNRQLQDRNLPLTILPGQEIRLYGELVNDIEHNDLLTMNQSGRYLFVELPTNHIPRFTKQLLFDIQLHDLVPVIVHPERNTEFLEHPNRLYEFVRQGVLTQITASSLVGKFGKKMKKFSHELIESNLTHFIASDAHGVTSRGFMMTEATKEIEKTYGVSTLYMFTENARLLVEGEPVFVNEPLRIERKKFFGLF
ncbi:protein-tyrosine phosphatase [Pelagirhabdus alkalitolerans]|uniref:Tyrosine-protein phosphatase n=1 Tax=Pelagirhabdus alkalitolerans TaxID=1612202 RepID=A0A1G6GGK7_9BACI|nr:CpsB/CapC family capsule biosynthesis tyrosine phosphatase [Pelagirhabdus alkalitolerans]SDB81127.1 protein-tyrosine phosphatase [Pelagirhabdus alkalitolerans]